MVDLGRVHAADRVLTDSLWGGDLIEGKTSNRELDAILLRCLPQGMALPCDTMPNLDAQRVEQIKRAVRRHGIIYFPLFIRYHWIAGIVQWRQREDKYEITIYDSAPSDPVQRDLRRQLLARWPKLEVVAGVCAKQPRGSEDCGLYMVASFFSHYLACAIGDARTVAARLRRFLSQTAREESPTAEFLAHMRLELEAKKGTRQLVPRHEEQELEGGRTWTIDELVEAHNAAAPAAARRQLCYMLVATVLANLSDGATRSLAIEALYMRGRRLGFATGEPADAAEALMRMGFNVHPYGRARPGEQAQLMDESVRDDKSQQYLLIQGNAQTGLPRQLGKGWNFRLGVQFCGKASLARGAYTGHYTLTKNPRHATIAVYMQGPTERDAHEDEDDGGSLQPESPHPSGVPDADVAESEDVGPGDVLHEQYQALHGTTTFSTKNGEGRREGGRACPRGWYIFPERPPHVSPVAWAAVTPEVRAAHVRWLRELRSMPSDLLELDLAQAVIQLVIRTARARKWQWSTISRTLATVKGALLNLPMYTTQCDGIDLSTSPEFRAAASAARRFEREAETHPPAPLHVDEMNAAYKELCRTHPTAALYLRLTWHCAARAGDTGSILTRDVHISELSETSPTALVSITIRYGKGAKFRGPYAVGTRLQRADAALLLKLVHSRRPTQRLFADVKALRDQVRVAIRKANPKAALPSIRKGSARHMAAHGVSESDLMRITGHTRPDTLRRYLGYGLQLTKEAAAARDSAAQALLTSTD